MTDATTVCPFAKLKSTKVQCQHITVLKTRLTNSYELYELYVEFTAHRQTTNVVKFVTKTCIHHKVDVSNASNNWQFVEKVFICQSKCQTDLKSC